MEPWGSETYGIMSTIEKNAEERYQEEGSTGCVVKWMKQNVGHACRMVTTT